ncbi:hypothetical protein KOW79_017958 [Hemibagrus wyckioides]|uniref:Secreted protein n=1 Tax=Hemibagrus wyckioides TaxID=337641 RepID=A0A9D3N8B2_9TELE|nr:hypothetical protein KOW79_017958 [Hemibagrus wyckioides]
MLVLVLVLVRAPSHTDSGLFLSVCFDTNRSERVVKRGEKKKIIKTQLTPCPATALATNQNDKGHLSANHLLGRCRSLYEPISAALQTPGQTKPARTSVLLALPASALPDAGTCRRHRRRGSAQRARVTETRGRVAKDNRLPWQQASLNKQISLWGRFMTSSTLTPEREDDQIRHAAYEYSFGKKTSVT